jgi:hypothetical protein
VITHEVGHAIGLPHNMIASSSFPVDSLRTPSFASVYGVSATIMDYARQNYVAQPGDGLAPKDFVRRLGPFDDFVINWGYRALPQAATPEAERPILNGWVINQSGPFPYRYSEQFLSGIDPLADRGRGGRSGEGDGLRHRQHEEARPATHRVDDQARRRL